MLFTSLLWFLISSMFIDLKMSRIYKNYLFQEQMCSYTFEHELLILSCKEFHIKGYEKKNLEFITRKKENFEIYLILERIKCVLYSYLLLPFWLLERLRFFFFTEEVLSFPSFFRTLLQILASAIFNKDHEFVITISIAGVSKLKCQDTLFDSSSEKTTISDRFWISYI